MVVYWYQWFHEEPLTFMKPFHLTKGFLLFFVEKGSLLTVSTSTFFIHNGIMFSSGPIIKVAFSQNKIATEFNVLLYYHNLYDIYLHNT